MSDRDRREQIHSAAMSRYWNDPRFRARAVLVTTELNTLGSLQEIIYALHVDDEARRRELDCPACGTVCHLEQNGPDDGRWLLVEVTGKNHRCTAGVRWPTGSPPQTVHT